MIRVYLTSDGDGHKYIIPYDLKDSFTLCLQAGYETEDFSEFENKFGKYATGGGYDNVELYANI